MPAGMLDGVRAVLYRELKLYSRHAGKQALASAVSPLLFFVAFGWGFGREVSAGGVPYLSFLVPGLVAMSSLTQSYGIAQEVNISRFYLRVFDEVMVAPVPPAAVVLGETLYGTFRGLLGAAPVLVVALLAGVPFAPTALFLPALALHAFAFAALGFAMAMLVRDHAGQAALSNFVITPMVFLGGTFFPLERLPEALRLPVALLPLAHSVRLLRDSFLGRGADPGSVAALLVFAAAFFLIGLRSLRRLET